MEKIKQIIDDAYELGVTKITLTGGECTITEDFLKICKYIRQKRIELIIFTNAQNLHDNQNLLNEIINLYPHIIGISLYSMDEKIHDKITKVNGSWKKTVNVIEKLIKANILVEIKCFLTKYNADSYEEVIEYAKKNNCQLAIDTNLMLNNTNSNIDTIITDEQLENFYKYAFKHKLTKQPHIINNILLEDIPCQSGHTTISIKPNLDITTCPNGNIIFGNLNKISLKDFWIDNEKTSTISKWRELKLKDFKECFKNDYCAYCDFCPLKYSNNISKKILCKTAKIKMKVKKLYVS